MKSAAMRAEAVARALGGRRSQGGNWVARCPAHDDRAPSLSIADGRDGRLLLHCFAGCDFVDVLEALKRLGVLPDALAGERFSPRFRREKADEDEQRRQALAARVWRTAAPATGTQVETYLRSRGILGPIPGDLRFAPALHHPSGVVAPAMVAAIRDREGALIGAHRTWLRADGNGKADLLPQKAMLGRAKGGAVRLSDGAGPLVVAEGIETTLTLRDALGDGARCWAALSAPGVTGLALPRPAGELICAADGDPAGEKAASGLARRALAEGWKVRIAAAPTQRDWNDLARCSFVEGS